MLSCKLSKEIRAFCYLLPTLLIRGSNTKKTYFTLKYTCFQLLKTFKYANLSQSLANKILQCTESAKRAVPPHENMIVSGVTWTWCFILFSLIAELWQVQPFTCSLWFQERRKNILYLAPIGDRENPGCAPTLPQVPQEPESGDFMRLRRDVDIHEEGGKIFSSSAWDTGAETGSE